MTMRPVECRLMETAEHVLSRLSRDTSARVRRAIEELQSHEQSGGTRLLIDNKILNEDAWLSSQSYQYAKFGVRLSYSISEQEILIFFIFVDPQPPNGGSPCKKPIRRFILLESACDRVMPLSVCSLTPLSSEEEVKVSLSILISTSLAISGMPNTLKSFSIADVEQLVAGTNKVLTDMDCDSTADEQVAGELVFRRLPRHIAVDADSYGFTGCGIGAVVLLTGPHALVAAGIGRQFGTVRAAAHYAAAILDHQPSWTVRCTDPAADAVHGWRH